MKLLVSLLLGSATLASMLSASPANAAWYSKYQCGRYTVGLKEVGMGNEYAYREGGPDGSFNLPDGGRKTMGEKSWIYSFETGNTTIVIEDKWGTGQNEPDSAYFTVIEFDEIQNRGIQTVSESCFKTDYGF